MNPVTDFAIDRAMHLVARILTGKRLRTRVKGIENLPTHGPAILVSRHYHHLFDGLAFYATVKRRFHIVVSLDWVANRRTKFFMATLNRLKAGFSVIAESAEHFLGKPIPLIPVGIHYEIGEPWIARLNFGPAVYRRDFASRQSLIAMLELEVQQLSAANGGYRKLD